MSDNYKHVRRCVAQELLELYNDGNQGRSVVEFTTEYVNERFIYYKDADNIFKEWFGGSLLNLWDVIEQLEECYTRVCDTDAVMLMTMALQAVVEDITGGLEDDAPAIKVIGCLMKAAS